VTTTKPENVKALIEHLENYVDTATYENDLALMSLFAHKTDCGTVGCIAGEAAMMAGYSLYGIDTLEIEREAIKFLGITGKEANVLFYASAWPTDLKNEYYAVAVRHYRRAERLVMAKRLKLLLEPATAVL
jgi:hypothetical protein